MVAADATDVFGDAGTSASRVATTLSVDGVRRLRSRLARDAEAGSTSACRSDCMRPVSARMDKAHLTGSAPTRPGGEPCEESG